tara:strand:- start:210 stop:812 length:603 start_codon:yes stop_codon:yes gene_type:complete
MAIKTKNKDPKSTELKPNDIIINTKTGTIFYKNERNELFKVQGDNLNTLNTSEQITKQITTLNFSFKILNTVTSEFFIPFNSLSEKLAAEVDYRHFMLAPFTGKLKQITLGALSADNTNLETITVRSRKSLGNDFDFNESEDIVESVVLTDCVVATTYDFNFINTSFEKGDQIAFTFQQSNASNDNIEILGTIVFELEIN